MAFPPQISVSIKLGFWIITHQRFFCPPAGLFVARQALSCLLTLDGSAELFPLVTVDKINSILRCWLLFLPQVMINGHLFQQISDCCVHYGYRKFPTDVSALLLGDLYYTRLSLSGISEHLSHNALLDLYQILYANLSSNISKVCQESRDLK